MCGFTQLTRRRRLPADRRRRLGLVVDIGAVERESTDIRATLVGDYNVNGAVDAADYTVCEITWVQPRIFCPTDLPPTLSH